MASIEHADTIAAPAALVFAFLTEPDKATAWQSTLAAARLSPDAPMQLGTRIRETRTLLGREIHSTVDVTEFDPPRRFGGHGAAGPMHWQFRYTLEERDGATHLALHLQGDGRHLFRLGQPIVLKAVKQQLVADLAKLREVVEERAE